MYPPNHTGWYSKLGEPALALRLSGKRISKMESGYLSYQIEWGGGMGTWAEWTLAPRQSNRRGLPREHRRKQCARQSEI
jgi:hypothetical protein